MSTGASSLTILRNIGGLVFDATLEETHESTLQVTNNPVETGVAVADHAFMDPLKLSVLVGVNDTNLHPSDADQFDGARRTKTAYDMLCQLQATAEPFDIQTGLRLYHNFVCTRLRVVQDKDAVTALVFEVDFQEIIFVSTQVVVYPPRAPGRTARQGSKTVTKGDQQGSQVTDPGSYDDLIGKILHALGVI